MEHSSALLPTWLTRLFFGADDHSNVSQAGSCSWVVSTQQAALRPEKWSGSWKVSLVSVLRLEVQQGGCSQAAPAPAPALAPCTMHHAPCTLHLGMMLLQTQALMQMQMQPPTYLACPVRGTEGHDIHVPNGEWCALPARTDHIIAPGGPSMEVGKGRYARDLCLLRVMHPRLMPITGRAVANCPMTLNQTGVVPPPRTTPHHSAVFSLHIQPVDRCESRFLLSIRPFPLRSDEIR